MFVKFLPSILVCYHWWSPVLVCFDLRLLMTGLTNQDLLFNWHERAAFQRSAFGRSTAGNGVVAIIFISRSLFSPFLAWACGVQVGRRSGGQLATTLVVTKNDIIFFLLFFTFYPSSTFLIEGVLGSKNLFKRKLRGRPNLGIRARKTWYRWYPGY